MSAERYDELAHLNVPQREAVLHGDGPLLVLAGAGTGKTSVITHRVAHMVRHRGVPPWQILAVTFTNKAAREMRERTGKLLGEETGGANALEMGTFHRLCGRMLRQNAGRVGLERNFAIYDADEQLQLVKRCAQERNIDVQQCPPRALRSHIEAWKNAGVSPQEAREQAGEVNDPVRRRALELYGTYQERLQQANAVDFSDMLRQAVVLLREHEDVRRSYQMRWSHLLVDEYQDTNPVQYAWLKLLVTPAHSLTVVGDDDQSIYRWRGADIGNILRFERDFPGSALIRLEENYRSTSTILDAANGVIAHNAARKGKTLFSRAGKGEPITFALFDTERDEGQSIAANISERLQAGTPGRDIAVLYRTNAQSRPLEDALRRWRVPYIMVGGTRFYDRKEVKDALAYLRLLTNPKDTLNFLRVVNVPARGIGKTSLERLGVLAEQRGIGLLDACNVVGEDAAAAKAAGFSARARTSLTSFATLLSTQRRAMLEGCGLGELLGHTLQDAGYLQALQLERTDEAQERLQNLQELASALDEYESSTENGDLAGFLEDVSLATDVDNLRDDAEDGTQGAVVLMTLHAAKGLEFGHVFLPGLEENLFPHSRSLEDRAALEEERRLCYVGLTRAKRTLALSAARVRNIFGQPQLSQVSRFVSEVPRELMLGAPDAAPAPTYEAAAATHGDALHSPGAPRQAASAWRPDRANVAPSRRPQAPRAVPTASAGDFPPGTRVLHATFGEGPVVASEGEGGRKKLTIDFPGWGRKTVVARFVTPAPVG